VNLCRDCAHLHGDARRDGWYRWLCTNYPVEPETNYVSGELTGPSRRCVNVRGREDSCPDFLKGVNVFNPKGTE